VIRRAESKDLAELSRLKLETFRETFVTDGFRIPYPPADLAEFEQRVYAIEAVAAELANPDYALWVVENDGVLIGYAKIGPCHLPHPDVRPNDGELYQLYVRREAQGDRIGLRLMQTALDHLAKTRPGPVWLGVWSGNHKAQRFYARLGFEHVGNYLFPVGEWRDEEFIFRRG
jgi:ribosomal protein S18 acetylase RimI-like enzyme